VSPQEVLAGAGSDELITLLLTALSRPRDRTDAAVVLTTTPTFVMYRLAARARGMRVLEVPLDANWDLSLDSMRRGAELAPPNLVFIASPNNPTGNLMARDRLEALITSLPESLVVIDEAYIDYAPGNQLELYQRFENVAILRTLSKIGFASLRVGWLIARAPLVAEIDKLRPPYNLCSLSQRLGALVTSELAGELAALCELVKSERTRVTAELEKLPGFRVTPSQANFLWLRTPGPAGELFAALAARGVLVRSFHQRGGRLAEQLRVTIGAPTENERLLDCLRELT
jgi:histidinol-phosphate aminotransferase